MLVTLITGESGWLLVVLIGTTILLPFLLRPTALSRALGLVERYAKPYLGRMWPHYWLGYAIAGLALAHAAVSMGGGLAGRVESTGLYLATGSLAFICAQVLLGRRLAQPTLAGRRKIRRWHLWTMLGVVILGLGHIALDSPTIAILAGGR